MTLAKLAMLLQKAIIENPDLADVPVQTVQHIGLGMNAEFDDVARVEIEEFTNCVQLSFYSE